MSKKGQKPRLFTDELLPVVVSYGLITAKPLKEKSDRSKYIKYN